MLERGFAVRVASWNIHRCIGGDGRRDPQRIIAAILSLDADVVALQEAETPVKSAHSSTSLPLLGSLAEQGYQPVLGPTILFDRHSYGNLLLTRLPVRRCERVDLSRAGREPRGLLDVSLELGRATSDACNRFPLLRCLATHLGLRRGERRAQFERILQQIDASGEVAGPSQPLVLLGDFNEWRQRNCRLASIDAVLKPAPRKPSFSARWPLLALDRLWYRHAVLECYETVRTPLTRIASDHLPLLARLRIARRGNGI